MIAGYDKHALRSVDGFEPLASRHVLAGQRYVADIPGHGYLIGMMGMHVTNNRLQHGRQMD